MSSKKQTAVDFIEKSLNRRNYRHFVNHREIIIVSVTTVQSILEQAKAMQKEQMKDAVLSQCTINHGLRKIFENQFEQYYNETYGGKND